MSKDVWTCTGARAHVSVNACERILFDALTRANPTDDQINTMTWCVVSRYVGIIYVHPDSVAVSLALSGGVSQTRPCVYATANPIVLDIVHWILRARHYADAHADARVNTCDCGILDGVDGAHPHPHPHKHIANSQMRPWREHLHDNYDQIRKSREHYRMKTTSYIPATRDVPSVPPNVLVDAPALTPAPVLPAAPAVPPSVVRALHECDRGFVIGGDGDDIAARLRELINLCQSSDSTQ